MKKLFFFGALLAAGLAVTSCSSDKDEVDESQQSGGSGSNYISIAINLPTNPASTTRAENDNADQVTYDDGLASEYYVNDASLIIFNASGDFVEAHKLEFGGWNYDVDDDNITEYQKFVEVSSKVTAANQMLVILNANGLIEVQPDNTLKVKKDGTLTNFAGSYSDLLTESNSYLATTSTLDCGDMNKTGFYMANAPLANKQGSTATSTENASVRTLVPITEVYKTEAEAAAATPDEIYVERGMAKITMNQGDGTSTMSVSKLGSTELKWKVYNWTLDNTNTTSYLVRSTTGYGGTDKYEELKTNSSAGSPVQPVYRTIGNTSVDGGASGYIYRTYFAQSANYNHSTALTRISTTTTFSDKFGSENPQYCFENTFSVNNMNVNNTTLVQIGVQAATDLSSPVDLYTINSDKSAVYDEAGIKARIQAAAAAYVDANRSILVSSGTSISSSDFTVTSLTNSADGSKVATIVVTYAPTSGNAELLVSNYEDGTGTDKTLTTALCTSILEYSGTITRYDKGISYYNIRIKHFGDNLTPWNNLETDAPSLTAIYPDGNADNNYLGRYGVLRNNWYDISVNSIRQIGDAVPHTANWDSTPDDEYDTYIVFKINVLSWAKRTQSATL